MGSWLDEMFNQKTPKLQYAWTMTDGILGPSIFFATGELSYTETREGLS
jgi:hypothetical protein